MNPAQDPKHACTRVQTASEETNQDNQEELAKRTAIREPHVQREAMSSEG
jgi:hypothetical protein